MRLRARLDAQPLAAHQLAAAPDQPDPLTVRDLFSRYLLGIALLSLKHAPVRRYFQALFRRFGQPKAIRVDPGAPFSGGGALELSRLSA